jgi:hypothetical protein
MPGGDRSTKWAGRARRVKAARLVGVSGRAPDPDHHLVARDKGGDTLEPRLHAASDIRRPVEIGQSAGEVNPAGLQRLAKRFERRG